MMRRTLAALAAAALAIAAPPAARGNQVLRNFERQQR